MLIFQGVVPFCRGHLLVFGAVNLPPGKKHRNGMPSTLPGEMASLPPPDGAGCWWQFFMLQRYLHEIWKNRKVIIFFGFRNSKHLNIYHSSKWFLYNFQHGFTQKGPREVILKILLYGYEFVSFCFCCTSFCQPDDTVLHAFPWIALLYLFLFFTGQ